jgi:hypothetical protein
VIFSRVVLLTELRVLGYCIFWSMLDEDTVQCLYTRAKVRSAYLRRGQLLEMSRNSGIEPDRGGTYGFNYVIDKPSTAVGGLIPKFKVRVMGGMSLVGRATMAAFSMYAGRYYVKLTLESLCICLLSISILYLLFCILCYFPSLSCTSGILTMLELCIDIVLNCPIRSISPRDSLLDDI